MVGPRMLFRVNRARTRKILEFYSLILAGGIVDESVLVRRACSGIDREVRERFFPFCKLKGVICG